MSMFFNCECVTITKMFVEIVKGRVCSVCGAPIGKMIDETGELLGFTCYGKTPHVVEPSRKELNEHENSRAEGEHHKAHLKFRNEM